MPENGNTLDKQEAVALHNLRDAQLAHRSACLALSTDPTDQTRQHEVDVLEAEIAQYQRTLARIGAARLAESQRDTAKEFDDAIDAAKSGKKAAIACAEIERKLVAELVDLLENEVGPRLVKLDVAQRERGQHIRQALRRVYSTKEMDRKSSQITRLTGTSDAGQALLAALMASGLGRTGPDLGGTVSIASGFSQPLPPAQSVERMELLANDFAELIDAGIECARNPQPEKET